MEGWLKALQRNWFSVQMDMPDANAGLLAKSAQGEGLIPVSQQELIDAIDEMEVGDEITVGGLRIRLQADGTVDISSTSDGQYLDRGTPGRNMSMAKSARRGDRPTPSFGDGLLSLYRAEERKHG